MAYKIVRATISGFTSRFKAVQDDDQDFPVAEYAELDDYLSTMEERGWSVVDVSFGPQSAYYLYITLHQPTA